MNTDSITPTATSSASIAPTTSFADLGLHADILRALTEAGYNSPTPIQAQAIPLVLAGRDLMGGAQTGTGKTAAFTLPLIQRLLPHATPSPSPARHPVRALILAPTRELAIQVHESVLAYSRYTHFRSLCVYGGVDIKPQIAELRKGVEFLVATPGRLLDHVEHKSVSFNSVEALVLDEADRMLDMGFIPDIRRILGLLPKQRQSLLFSATFSDEIKRLADTMLVSPTLIEVARRNTVSDTITHRVYPVAAHLKQALLIDRIRSGELGQAIVFTRTKQETRRLSRELTRVGISADALHGDKSQIERIKALDGFKNGQIHILVATDVAARGLDIDELPCVINYELPHIPEDYVHRIGRTGRAGRLGNAISLVSSHEVDYLAEIEKLIRRPIEQVSIPGFETEGDYTYPPEERKKGRKSTPPPFAPVARETARRSKGNALRNKQSTIAADGFDFSQPYTPRADLPEKNPPLTSALPQRPKKMVAALLGGLNPKR